MLQDLSRQRDQLLIRYPFFRLAAEWSVLQLARLNRVRNARPLGQNTVMFHNGRSGSQVLASLLAQQPEIYWDNELFWQARQRAYRSMAGEQFDPMEIIRLAPYKTGRQWYGWEIKVNHFRQIKLDRTECIQMLKSLGYDRFIVLQRKSLLRQFVSIQLLRTQDDRTKTHVHVGEAPRFRQVHIDPEQFLNFAKQTEIKFALLKNDLAGENVLELTYEDHIEQDPRVAQILVCDFLGIETAESQVRLQRGNPFPLSKVISNYDSVVEVLASSPYAHMLDQDTQQGGG